jgi:hypothetical protein
MIRFKLSHTLPAVLLLAIASLPAQASADDLQTAPAGEEQALGSGELEATNGLGVDLDAVTDNSINGSLVSSQELSATNTDNNIGGDVLSGNVSFADQALQGFSGIGNFAINTGAQSNIQSSISINIMTVAP